MEQQQGRTDEKVIVLALGLLGTLASFLAVLGRQGDSDMFWHIATGRYILAHHSIPSTDVFSWWGIANHRPWTPHEWLYDIGAWLAYQAGGFIGLTVATVLLTGIATALVYLVLRARGLGWFGSTVGTLVVLSGLAYWTVQRPQVFTLVMIFSAMLLLERQKWWWALIPVAVSANTHGGLWPIFIIVFAFYCIPRKPWVFLASVVATGLSPHPLAVWGYPFLQFMQTQVLINEFQPTVIWKNPAALLLIIGLVVLTHRVRVPLKDALLSIAIVVLAMTAQRHLVWLYVLVLPILAPYAGQGLSRMVADGREWLASHAGAETRSSRAASRTGAAIDRVAAIDSGKMLGFVSLALVVAAGGFAIADAYTLSTKGYDPRTYYPVAMTELIKKRGITDIYNYYDEGGYLIFAGVEPMVDGRWDPFVSHTKGERSMLEENFGVLAGTVDPGFYMDKYDIRWVMIPRRLPLFTQLAGDSRFRLDTFTKTHALFEYAPKKATSGPASSSTPSGTPGASVPSSSVPATP